MGNHDDSNRARRIAGERPAGDEVDEEIQFHLHMMTNYLMSQGMTNDEARRAAERRFGSIDSYRRSLTSTRHRARRWLALATAMGNLREDMGFAFRCASRSPGFTVGVVLTIALGVGANATMYGVIDRILLTAPPHITNPHEVKRLYVERSARGQSFVSAWITYPDFRDWEAAESFQSAAAFSRARVTLGHGRDAQRVQMTFATASLFPLLGAVPHRGRFFVLEDDVPGASPVVVLGYDFWKREFGASDDVLGRTLDLGRDRFTVVGVAPRGFTGVDLARIDVWAPLQTSQDAEAGRDHRGYYWIHSIARLGAGVGVQAAAAEATTLHRAGRAESRNYDPEARVIVASLMAASGPNASDESTVARWLAGVSIIVLVIACANVANLLLAQGAQRRREIAVRLALGVSRSRLVRQLLAGSVLFALFGAIGALVIAEVGGHLVGSVLLPDADWSLGIVSGRVLWFTLAVALLTGLVAGLIPALQSSKSDLISGLRDGSRGSARRSRTRVAFLLAQPALSMVLLVGAGLFVRSLNRVGATDFGWEPDRLFVATLETEPGAADRAERVRLYSTALERLHSLPVVQAASAVHSVPFYSSFGGRVRAEGLDSIPRLASGGPYYNIVTPDYFAAVDLRILRGRGFTDADVEGTARAAVVGETMARHLWPDGEALGRCLYITLDDDAPCTEIVGIAEDARRQEVIEDPQLLYYIPAAQNAEMYNPRAIFVRTSSDADGVQATLQREVYAAVPSLRLVRVNRFADLLAPQLRSWKLGATVFSAFGLLALVVAAVGLYSMLSFEVAQRRAEIGVRAALGATGTRLVTWVVADGVRFVAIGIALGGAAAFFAGRAIEPLLYETSARDPLIYALVTATLLAVAVTASLLPAMRTTRVEPSEALKAE